MLPQIGRQGWEWRICWLFHQSRGEVRTSLTTIAMFLLVPACGTTFRFVPGTKGLTTPVVGTNRTHWVSPVFRTQSAGRVASGFKQCHRRELPVLHVSDGCRRMEWEVHRVGQFSSGLKVGGRCPCA